MISENAKLLLEKCEPLLELLLRYRADGNPKKGYKDMKGKRASSSITQEVPYEVCLNKVNIVLDNSCYIVETPNGQSGS